MLPQEDGNKLIQLKLQSFLNENFFIILYNLCYSIQLRLEDYRLEITNPECQTEVICQAVSVNMLILKAHFHFFWVHVSLSCTYAPDIANNFICGMGSMNILWMLTDDHNNVFYETLHRNCVEYLGIGLLCKIITFSNIFLYFQNIIKLIWEIPGISL